RLNSRSNNSACSPDTCFTESSKSSSRNKQKPIIRNAANRIFPNQDSKSSCSVTLHVPDAQSTASVDSNNSVWKISALNKEIESLRAELDQAKGTITTLQDNEQRLKSRLAEQAQKMLERGAKFENVCLGEKRPTALVRHYGNLYAQARVDTLDALDALVPLKDADELKTKILFSVIVLSFRSVQTTVSDMKDQIYAILQVKDLKVNDIALNELENGISVYLRKTAETFNLKKNVSEVCSQIYATLYDYPCLKNCTGLINYAKDCVRLAWCLTNQNPSYVIDYETRTFRKEIHMRFHTSNQASNVIKSYLWPALVEGDNGPCVHRGVVLT
ncbi:MIEAP domain-containing protein, partial [Trichonephila clavata]